MAADLSGSYDYNALLRTLKDNGVKSKDLMSAAKKVGADNDIDNIKDLDGTKEITISESIFKTVDSANATNPFENKENSEVLKSYAASSQTDIKNLPEVFNEDEYDVADYEEFYNFGSQETTNDNAQEQNNGSNENAKANSQDLAEAISQNIQNATIANQMIQNQAFMEQFGQALGMDTNGMFDQSMLNSALFASMLNQKEQEIETSNSEEDSLSNGVMMEMDMQNDSFNPQG